jgi:hypothetical protein
LPRIAAIRKEERTGNSITVRELKLWRKMKLNQLERLIEALGGRLTAEASFADRVITIAPYEPLAGRTYNKDRDRDKDEKPVSPKPPGAHTNSEILQMWRDASQP